MDKPKRKRAYRGRVQSPKYAQRAKRARQQRLKQTEEQRLEAGATAMVKSES